MRQTGMRAMRVAWLLAGTWALAAAAQTPAPAGATAGQNVTGTVINATSGKPQARQTVTLVQLQGNMQPVATTTTDAQGRYRFSESVPGPFMVEADYQGVPYFAQVTQGQSETNVQVDDASGDASLMNIDAEIMVLQPDAGQLAIVNEYRVDNELKPARTLYSKAGLFRFRVPAGAKVDMVRVVAPNEMPLARQADPTGQPDVYRVATPLRPGETSIQISYRLPYAALKTAVTEQPVIKPAHFEVYVPSPMTFAGDGFAQVGQQDGYVVYGVAPNQVPATLTFNVAGTAPLPAAANDNASSGGATTDTTAGSGTAAPAPDDSATAAPSAPAGAIPEPTFFEKNLWMILALLGLGAAAGLGILLARPAEAMAVAGGGGSGAGAPIPVAAVPTAAASPGGDELRKLKDDLFLLEVRRHTGNLDAAEYERLRAELNARMDRLAGK